MVRDEDHGPLLDHGGRSLLGRLRPLLPLLPAAARVTRTLVYGLARSGLAAAAALEARGDEVVRVDRDNEDDLGLLLGVDLLVKSPGVPAERPLVVAARERGIPVWSEIELGWRLLAPHPFVGVTGTNGKTTTCELLGAIFRAASRPVVVAGNVGTPLSGVHAPENAWIVCEMSSFQLEDVHELACETFARYRDAKFRIFERARTHVVPRGLGLAGITFSADDALPAEPLMPGRHNRENAAAACVAARAAGVGDDAIAEALRTFPGVPHRLELIREREGVRWVNDSKATNTSAARRGVEAYDGSIRLILGGRAKGEDFAPFARDLPPNVVSIYLVGE
ncbi:MAG: hypothetical protein E6J13_16775, partial [Chloroflexi bacterium]